MARKFERIVKNSLRFVFMRRVLSRARKLKTRAYIYATRHPLIILNDLVLYKILVAIRNQVVIRRRVATEMDNKKGIRLRLY